jgi:hypothetical protein
MLLSRHREDRQANVHTFQQEETFRSVTGSDEVSCQVPLPLPLPLVSGMKKGSSSSTLRAVLITDIVKGKTPSRGQ